MKLKKDRGIFDIEKRKNGREQTNQNTEEEEKKHTYTTQIGREKKRKIINLACVDHLYGNA